MEAELTSVGCPGNAPGHLRSVVPGGRCFISPFLITPPIVNLSENEELIRYFSLLRSTSLTTLREQAQQRPPAAALNVQRHVSSTRPPRSASKRFRRFLILESRRCSAVTSPVVGNPVQTKRPAL